MPVVTFKLNLMEMQASKIILYEHANIRVSKPDLNRLKLKCLAIN